MAHSSRRTSTAPLPTLAPAHADGALLIRRYLVYHMHKPLLAPVVSVTKCWRCPRRMARTKTKISLAALLHFAIRYLSQDPVALGR